jgi:hypothetical protein
MAITKYLTPKGELHEGLVMWLDFAGVRTKFVMPYDTIGWALVHYPTGQRLSAVYDQDHVDRIIRDHGLSKRASKREIMQGLLTSIVKKFGLKKVRKHLSAPVINL